MRKAFFILKAFLSVRFLLDEGARKNVPLTYIISNFISTQKQNTFVLKMKKYEAQSNKCGIVMSALS